MKPIDYRNETFEALLARGLVSERLAVYEAFKKFGPGTTREIARKSGIDILSFRPRTTELYQLGFLKCFAPPTGEHTAHEGVYRAYTWEEARVKFFADKHTASLRGHQPELAL